MIKLVQGFDIGSPLPIDGRILLSKREMIGNFWEDPDTKQVIDLDNILPEHYFAFCTDNDDNRLYLYNKNNPVGATGKFILADKQLQDSLNNSNIELKSLINSTKRDLTIMIDDLNEDLSATEARLENLISNEQDRATSEEIRLNESLNELSFNVIDNYNEFKDHVHDNNVDISKLNSDISNLHSEVLLEESERKNEDNNLKDMINSNFDELNIKINDLSDSVDFKYETVNNELNTLEEDLSSTRSELINLISNTTDDLNDYKELNDSNIENLTQKVNVNESNIVDIENVKIPSLINSIDNLEENINTVSDSVYNEQLRAEEAEDTLTNKLDNIESKLDTQKISSISNFDQSYNQEGIVDGVILPNTVNNILTGDEEIKYSKLNIATIDSAGVMSPSNVLDIDELKSSINKKIITDIVPFNYHPNYAALTYKEAYIDDSKVYPEYTTQTIESATSLTAGLMTADNYNTLINLQQRVEQLSGGTVSLTFKQEGEVITDSEGVSTFKISYVDKNTLSTYTVTYTIDNNPEIPGELLITPDEYSKQYGLNFVEVGKDSENRPLFRIFEIGWDIDPIVYSYDEIGEFMYREADVQNINSFAIDQGYEEPFKGLAITASNSWDVWRYYSNIDTQTGIVVGWTNDGSASISKFTNESEGLIKGVEKDGFVSANTDGTGSVFGWGKLEENVLNNQNKLSNISSSATRTAWSDINGNLKITSLVGGLERTEDLPVYIHPAGNGSDKQLGLYKFSTDGHSHINQVTKVTQDDILPLVSQALHQGDGIKIVYSPRLEDSYIEISTDHSTEFINIPSNDWVLNDNFYTQTKPLPPGFNSSSAILDISLDSVNNQDEIQYLLDEWAKIINCDIDDDTKDLTLFATEALSRDIVIKAISI